MQFSNRVRKEQVQAILNYNIHMVEILKSFGYYQRNSRKSFLEDQINQSKWLSCNKILGNSRKLRGKVELPLPINLVQLQERNAKKLKI
jgi:hypothetical protein